MQSSKTLQFMFLIGKLKSTVRRGWFLKGVNNPESIADHMYRMSIFAFMIDGSQTTLHKERCMKLSLVHDMAECIVGDITPVDNICKEDKFKLEQDAMTHICTLTSKETGIELMELWNEYEHQTSNEAKFVKDCDRFDMILQAYEYEMQENSPGRLQEFFDSVQHKIEDETVKGWLHDLKESRGRYAAIGNASGDSIKL